MAGRDGIAPDPTADLFLDELEDHTPLPVSAAQRAVTAGLVIIPFLGLLAAVALLWGRGLTTIDLALFGAMYVMTGLGITLGYHRLFAHHSYQTVSPITTLLAIWGSMAAQGPLLIWTAVHRRHHQHSDEADDPHSPHGFGDGAWAVLKGAVHAHLGWMFVTPLPELERYVPDLMANKTLRWISDTFVLWVALGLVVPGVIGGLLTQSWVGALSGLLWGGLVRLFFVHHLTWSINSVCHIWGARDYRSRDESRNNVIFGVLAFGEGWHNNHHAFPASARHGLRWWQFDLTYVIIRLLERVGLIWRVRVPSADALAAKRLGGESLAPTVHPVPTSAQETLAAPLVPPLAATVTAAVGRRAVKGRAANAAV
ncbi:MAG: acyl-CoA desaturase [Phycisphaerae bacterium]